MTISKINHKSPQPGEYGGLTEVARVLNGDGDRRDISRQNVYMWWRRRETNGFPERHRVPARYGRERGVFKISEVLAWYETYVPSPGGRGKRTRTSQ